MNQKATKDKGKDILMIICPLDVFDVFDVFDILFGQGNWQD